MANMVASQVYASAHQSQMLSELAWLLPGQYVHRNYSKNYH